MSKMCRPAIHDGGRTDGPTTRNRDSYRGMRWMADAEVVHVAVNRRLLLSASQSANFTGTALGSLAVFAGWFGVH